MGWVKKFTVLENATGFARLDSYIYIIIYIFYMWHRWPLHLLANHLRNILSESALSLAVLAPASSSMAAVSKAFTPLPRKRDRSDAEVGERHESHTLRFGKWKCVTCFTGAKEFIHTYI